MVLELPPEACRLLKPDLGRGSPEKQERAGGVAPPQGPARDQRQQQRSLWKSHAKMGPARALARAQEQPVQVWPVLSEQMQPVPERPVEAPVAAWEAGVAQLGAAAPS